MSQSDGPTDLNSLFATSTLIVPPFQRAFAWEVQPHLRDFLHDLRTHPSSGEKPYFFGTVLLKKADGSSKGLLQGYDVVDGQQRLTTSSVFVAAALRKLRHVGGYEQDVEDFAQLFLRDSGGRRKFRTIAEDDGFFERFILGDEPAGEADCHTPSQHRLRLARSFFCTEIDELAPDDLTSLLSILAQSRILVYAVATHADATQIFELQNDRGKRLTDLEALKSFLMHG